MVEDADKNQAPTQRIADKWASRLVPIALLIAVLAYVITGDIVRAVTVMVVFCPCALVLATPTAIMAAIGQATKHGVIIKSGEALENMGRVDTIAFDKTGTLTYGRLEVTDIIPLGQLSEKELLLIAASAESRSEHPLGKAIAEKAKIENLPLSDATAFKMTAGRGIAAEVNGVQYLLGSESFIREAGLAVGDKAAGILDRLRAEGKASVVVAGPSAGPSAADYTATLSADSAAGPSATPAADSAAGPSADSAGIIGIIALSDVLRPEAPDMVSRLAEMGTKAVLLTGDNRKAAEYFASKCGITEIHADLLPEQKVGEIISLMKSGSVCMIGDGVNDAPALKTADVGVAMGAMGSDIAARAADIALMTDDISKLPYLKWLSDTTVKTIRTAITLLMCINFVAITLSVLGILTPTTGALVHNAGSCFVVLLAALLYDRKY